jgi:hypothetical protein
MEIISAKKSSILYDGRTRKEYRLSSPVTYEVLAAISKGNHRDTGHQYLSSTYSLTIHDKCEMSGILLSPIIVLVCPPGMSAGIEDYLSEFLSTIPDSEKPETPFHRFLQAIRSSPLMKM